MVGQRSWMLLVACLGATVTTSPPNAVRPLSQLLSPTPLAQRQLKHEGLPCFCALLPEMMSGAPRAQCAVQSRQRRRGSLGLAATTASPLSGAWKRTEVDGRRTCAVYTPGGLVPYEEALRWQQALQRERIDHKVALRGQDEAPTLPDALILLEHPTVYTLGSSSEMSDMLFSMPKEDLSEVGSSVVVPAVGAEPAFQIHRVQRGGKVTYHAPGQLVGYPVFDLSRHSQDIACFAQQM
ncbi:hypothetical protein T484DRAFT_1798182 [Baffinella frigidus]|nr:hypothetical protein T484DRAFT_1798182 [Cryptophyta sp. CCMP2293]